jgi:hypothetical protein
MIHDIPYEKYRIVTQLKGMNKKERIEFYNALESLSEDDRLEYWWMVKDGQRILKEIDELLSKGYSWNYIDTKIHLTERN